jgi:hypothetical protein
MADFYASLKETASGLIRQFGAEMLIKDTATNGVVTVSNPSAVRTQRSTRLDEHGVPIGDWDYIVEASEGLEIEIGNVITFAGSREIVMFAEPLNPAGTKMIWMVTTRFG